MTYNIICFSKIEDINKELIIEASTHNPLLNISVLKALENTQLGKTSRYFIILNNDKKPVFWAVAYVETKAIYHNLENVIYSKIAPLLRLLTPLNPSLSCQFPYSPSYEMFAFKTNTDKKDIFDLFLKELNLEAKKLKCKTSSVIGLRDEELSSNDYKIANKVFSGFGIYFNTKLNTLEDLSIDLSRSKRQNIRREIRKFENSANTLDKLNTIKEYKEQILKMFSSNIEKYKYESKEELIKEFIEEFDKNNLLEYLVIKDSNSGIAGCAMLLKANNNLYGLRIGTNENRDHFDFFYLSVYGPVSYAIKNKISRLDTGTASYQYKMARGGKKEKIYTLVNADTNIKNIMLKTILGMYSKYNYNKHVKKMGN